MPNNLPLSDKELEEHFPDIHWREPIVASSSTGKGLVCRFCLAQNGLKASDIPKLPQTIEEFQAHMKEKHEP